MSSAVWHWAQVLALLVELLAVLFFLLGGVWSKELETTSTVAVTLVLVLVTADALLLLYVRNRVLERFLRWVLYFQVVTPLALIYGMLVAVRGTMHMFTVYFLGCLVLLPAARLVLLCVDGVVEFVVKDES
tara:strand:+ start:969 stop:1361 length:393 start_codon:yes stop_codon:yes gene_type:complete